MFAGLAGLAAPNSTDWVGPAGWLAILAAGFLVLARILRLGFLADFLSSTVLIGFLTGDGAIMQAFNAIKDIPQAGGWTVVVSASVLIVIVGSKFISKKIPGALIAVVGAIAASAYFGLVAMGVSTLGTIPSGLPRFGVPALPPSTAWSTLIATAASLFLVILAQSAATSRAYAVKYDDDSFSENVDLAGLGLSNVSAALSGTFVVNGSPTKTEMVDNAGGKSQVSQVTTAVIVLVVLLFLTKPLSFALSLIAHVRHSYRPTNLLISYENGERKTHPPKEGVEAARGLALYHFGANLYYANAQAFQTEAILLVDELGPNVEWFVLDASGIGDIDFTAAETMRKLVPALKKRGVTLKLTDVTDHMLAELKASDLRGVIGADNIYRTLRDAVDAFATRVPSAGNASRPPPSGP